jgi:hypothetical protein
MIIRASINITKIDKSKLFAGKNGTYLDIALLENRNGPDQYGNNFMIVQETTKEEREKGIKGAILGNGKFAGGQPAASTPDADAPPESDDVPF